MKLRGFRKNILLISLIITILTANLIVIYPLKTEAITYNFTLSGLEHGGGVRPDYFNFFKQHLSRIGIQLDVRIVDFPTYVQELLYTRNFDITFLGLSGGGYDPDYTGIYNENGSLNIFGYDTSIDWDEDLGTGVNEWYLREGTKIMPPNSPERIQHYWEWQDYLMDKICPMLPAFSPQTTMAYWSNLEGYNYTNSIVQSWGKMSWDGSHEGQVSTDEIVIDDAAWTDLNPLSQDNTASSFISSACMDPLISIDGDQIVWPHLAESYTHINDTHVRIKVREGVKWASDFEGNFTIEYLDVEDVYFTFFCWKHLSSDQHLYDWIESMEIIDNYTIDFYIDGNQTTEENEPYAPYLSTFTNSILPEHYLNQTQLPDGVTPDSNHTSWEIFSNHCFGTGLFEINQFYEGIETILTVNLDSWRLNDSITSDSNLDWNRRFGDFSGGLDQLRIRILPNIQIALIEFEAGKVDLFPIEWNPDKRDEFLTDFRFDLQHKPTASFSFIAYNMRENRPHIGSREPCPLDDSITIGLAVRKAISYAINLVEINNNIHSGEYAICYTPLHPASGVWINPNIIRYNYNLQKAKYYMDLAGYNVDYTPATGISKMISGYTYFIALSTILWVVTVFIKRKKYNDIES